jgi:hypothetical protein
MTGGSLGCVDMNSICTWLMQTLLLTSYFSFMSLHPDYVRGICMFFPPYILRPKERSNKAGFSLIQFVFCVLLHRSVFSIQICIHFVFIQLASTYNFCFCQIVWSLWITCTCFLSTKYNALIIQYNLLRPSAMSGGWTTLFNYPPGVVDGQRKFHWIQWSWKL